MENLIKIKADEERARSLVNLARLRYKKISVFDEEKESSLIVEDYYETIKELITAILFIDGYKTLSHKDLIEYLSLNYKGKFNSADLGLIDQLRKLRNGIVYYGESIESSYIKRNKGHINEVISKLFDVCEKKLK